MKWAASILVFVVLFIAIFQIADLLISDEYWAEQNEFERFAHWVAVGGLLIIALVGIGVQG